MFTGIIEATGRVSSIGPASKEHSAVRLIVDLGSRAAGLRAGQSVSVNGACLTVSRRSGAKCSFDLIEETAKRTCLGRLKKGDAVNIERSLRAGDRLDGHFVLGHVDGVGKITRIQKQPGQVQVWLDIPPGLSRYAAPKGSIAIDGISLTIASAKKGAVSVCLVPHTLKLTNFASKRAGDRVNIEADVLARYALGK